MDFDYYKLYFRDAYIHKLQQSKEGQEYLENAYYFNQTEPDREKLRETFNKDWYVNKNSIMKGGDWYNWFSKT